MIFLWKGQKIRNSLQNQAGFTTPYVNSVYHRTESIAHLGPKIWDIVPEEIKPKSSLIRFK